MNLDWIISLRGINRVSNAGFRASIPKMQEMTQTILRAGMVSNTRGITRCQTGIAVQAARLKLIEEALKVLK